MMDEKQLLQETRELLDQFQPEEIRSFAEKLHALWSQGAVKSTNLVKKSQQELHEHLGIAHDLLKAIGTEIGKQVKKDFDAFLQLAGLLWDNYGREGRMVAVYILEGLVLIQPSIIFARCLELAPTCISWEECDNLVYGIEPIVRKEPEVYLKGLEAWLQDPNKWVKRVALTTIGRLPLKKPEYTRQCLAMITPCLDENDLDLRRVNSFAIRLCARGNLQAVHDYLRENSGGESSAKIWVFSDVIRSMTKAFLPGFQSLLPVYQNWLSSVKDTKSKQSLTAAIKTLEK